MAYCVLYPNGITFIKSSSRQKEDPSSIGGKRGRIIGFSSASYRRLKRFILSISSPLNFFVTLTYPSKFPHASISKYHLHKFFTALRYYFPQMYFVWKLEPQKRSAPHFHLLGDFGLKKYNKKIVKRIQKLVSKLWYQVVGSGDEKHLRAGTQVKYLPAVQRDLSSDFASVLCLYLSKYFSKTFQSHPDWQFPGRFWGVYGREFIRTEECKIFFRTRDYFFLYRIFKNLLISKLVMRKKKDKEVKSKRYMKRFYQYSFLLFYSFTRFLSIFRCVLSRYRIKPVSCRFYTYSQNSSSCVIFSF